ncbi:MAG: TonB-dependent receptor [Flavobacteriales bacterium]
MQKAVRNNLLFFFLLLLTCNTINGQNSSENESLSIILKNLESKHNIRFSYATNDVNHVFLIPPQNNFSLQKSLNYIEQHSIFTFKKINNRYISLLIKNEKNLICGTIIDASSNQIIEGASVIYSKNKNLTTSNSKGVFYIPKTKENLKITIHLLGYEDIIITNKNLSQNCKNVLLYPKASSLDQVIVKQYITKGISKKNDGSFNLNSKAFGIVPGQIENDIFQIIQAIPGIESIDESITNINIRGGTQDENLILWDDIKMYQKGHFFGLISAFNPDLTKKANVIKNGTHSRYGESVSGIIDMKSEDRIANHLTGGIGSNLINASAYLEIPISKKIGIQLSSRRSINSIFETGIYNNYTNKIFQDTEIFSFTDNEEGIDISANEDFNFYDFSGKILWNFSKKDKLRINYLTIKNNLQYKETLNETENSKTSHLNQETLATGISWKHDWNHNLSNKVLAYTSFYQLEALNQDIFSDQEQKQNNEVLETGLKLDFNYKYSNKALLEMGYHFSEIGITNKQDINTPNFFSKEKNILQTHIIYAQAKYSLFNDKTIINGGLRYHYFTDFNQFLLEPRFNLHHQLNKNFAIELLGEQKSQTTTQRIDFQSDFLGVIKRRWILADQKETPIIKSKQISLGFLYKNNNWFIEIEGFLKKVNGITTANQGFQNQFQFTKSTGNYTSNGIELAINKKTTNFDYWVSYVFMNNQYNFKQLTPSKFPNNLEIKNSLTLACSYSINKLKMAFGAIWRNGKPYTIPVKGNETINIEGENTINYNLPNSKNLPDYLRVNFSATYQMKIFKKLDLKMNLALLNLLNRKNTINIRYAINTNNFGETRISQVKESSLGFSPNFSLQFLF